MAGSEGGDSSDSGSSSGSSTGRKVVGFASTTRVEEPRFMAEVFKLE
jgi:hypothetical protein